MYENQVARVEVSSPIAKFFIGILAGCAAIAIPWLSSFLISSEEVNVNYFPHTYLVGVVVFAILIGLLVMTMEFKLPRPPKETLFAALAIPGLIAGSLNIAMEAEDANKMQKKQVSCPGRFVEGVVLG